MKVQSNPCHNPPGPGGGQFCSGSGGQGSSKFEEFSNSSDGFSWAVENRFNHGKYMPSEKRALGSYRSADFTVINYNLRNNLPLPQELQANVKDIDNVLKRSTIQSDVVLYRGAKSDILASELTVGKVFSDKAFVSTSYDKNLVKERFIKNMGGNETGILFKIQAPKGTKGLWVDSFGRSFGEGEILLQRNLSMKVLKIANRAGIKEITVGII